MKFGWFDLGFFFRIYSYGFVFDVDVGLVVVVVVPLWCWLILGHGLVAVGGRRYRDREEKREKIINK